MGALREESSQANVILQYKLLTSILSEVYSVIQQSYYVCNNFIPPFVEEYTQYVL